MRVFRQVSLMALGAVVGLCVPIYDSAGQATPDALPGVTARTTALLVSAIHDPFQVTGSDGLVHVEYDLVVTNAFGTPVTLEQIEVLTPTGESLLQLSGDVLTAATQPLSGSTKPTSPIPAHETVGVIVDIAVPPDQVPDVLTHHITYALAPDAPAASIIGSLEIDGPELTVDPFQPVVIASPLQGDGWLNANGCCDASPHRVARLAVDGNHLVKAETFAIDWVLVKDGRLFSGDGAEAADWYGFGAELLAVADGTVVFVRDGMPEEIPFQPVSAVQQPLDYSGNQVVIEIAPGVYAIYAHLQPGSIQVQTGQTVTAGQMLGLLGNTGNSIGPHLHFQLSDGPDLLTANSLPFVITDWTLAGTAELDMSTLEVSVASESTPQRETLPLELDVSNFP